MIEKKYKLEELDEFARYILEYAKECRVILLKGDLASGKTTLVRNLTKVLGLQEAVTSPTFSVQNVYGGELYHYDIYQNGVDGFLSSGLLEELDKEGYHVIEWADEKLEVILKRYLIDFITIEIEKSENSRIYKVVKCIN